jgi:hypothetical protein
MQSPAYQNQEVQHLAAHTSPAWISEEHLPTSMTTTIIIKQNLKLNGNNVKITNTIGAHSHFIHKLFQIGHTLI